MTRTKKKASEKKRNRSKSETLQRRIRLINRRSSKLVRQARFVGRTSWQVMREAAASVLTYQLYPLGIPTRSMPVFSLPKIGGETTPEVPILFVHGLFHNPSTFAWIKQKLALRGFKHFSDMDLLTLSHTIPELAQQTLERVEEMLEEFQVPQVDIIAHSMGGIVSRYMLQKLGGDGKVRTLITLGTPHQGTKITKYFNIKRVQTLSPDSQVIQDLNGCPLPQRTRVVVVSGGMDVLMWPRDCVRWEGVRNIHLPGVGHAGLLFSRRVLQIIIAHLHPQLLR